VGFQITKNDLNTIGMASPNSVHGADLLVNLEQGSPVIGVDLKAVPLVKSTCWSCWTGEDRDLEGWILPVHLASLAL
jgi:hypothetical protein